MKAKSTGETGRILSEFVNSAVPHRALALCLLALVLALVFAFAFGFACLQAQWLNKILHGYLKYDLPLWLTEFACGDEAAKMNANGQASYLADALTLLELHPAVARYAW